MEFYAIPEGGRSLEEGGGSKLRVVVGFIYLFSLYLFFKNYFIVQLQLSAFSPHPSTPPQPNPPPSPASTLPFGFVHVSCIVGPENPSLHYPVPPPLWLLLDCS